MNKILFVIAIFANGLVAFAQGIPNTFSAGDTVSASKINQNFGYLDGKSKRLVLKNNGSIIGDLTPVVMQMVNFATTHHYMLQTKKGYFIALPSLNGYFFSASNSGKISQVLKTGISPGDERFTSSDCSGDIYTEAPVGLIFYSAKKSALYYVPYIPEVYRTVNVNFTIRSMGNYSGGCTSVDTSGSDWTLSKALPNDESVTGWPSDIGTLTIAYE